MSGRILAHVAEPRDATAPLARLAVLKAVLLGYAVFAATYLPINHWSIGRDAAILYLPGEKRLPFLPQFEYLYALTYVLPFAFVAYPPDARGMQRAVAAFALTLGVAYATYLAFPVYLERPHLEVTDLATFLLALEYLDPSYNHFPSLHVALSWLVYLACRERVRQARLFLVTMIGVSISTLFVKQHYLADVLYGFVLAVAAWRVAGRLVGRRA